MKNNIEYRKLKDLKLLENNPRKISKEAMEQLVKSITDNPDYFEARPIILSDRTGELVIIAGNQRYKAAKKIGLKQVPTFLLSGLTEEKEREIVIRDNVSNGEWDNDILRDEWGMCPLEDWGVSVDWKAEEEPKEAKEDDFSEEDAEQAPSICQKGDIWQLGEHRLMCGDSTSKDNVERLMNGVKADMVFTDPPYGIKIVNKNGKVGAENLAKNRIYKPIMGDNTIEVAQKNYSVLRDMGIDRFIIWGGNYFIGFLPFSDGWIIWDKRGNMNSNNFADGEMAWCSFHTPLRIYKQIWNGMIREGEHEKRVHPTQKPIKMLCAILKDFTKDNNIILDTFGGSGSTMMACEQLNRKCYMMELDPHYCDVIIARWEKLTGKQAVKISAN